MAKEMKAALREARKASVGVAESRPASEVIIEAIETGRPVTWKRKHEHPNDTASIITYRITPEEAKEALHEEVQYPARGLADVFGTVTSRVVRDR